MPPLPPTIRLSAFSKGSERDFATICALKETIISEDGVGDSREEASGCWLGEQFFIERIFETRTTLKPAIRATKTSKKPYAPLD